MLSACDFVRFPGDGGPSPTTPDAGPAVPPGAPGPPPPSAPVDNPYGADGEDTPTDPADDAEDTANSPDTDDLGDGPDPVDADNPATDPIDVDTPTEDIPDVDTPDTDPATTPEDEDASDQDTNPEMDANTATDTDTETPGDTLDDTDIPAEDISDDDGDDAASLPDPIEPVEPTFSYFEAGALLPGSGQGAPEQIAYAPDLVFPIADAPTYLQSQVFSFGGGVAGATSAIPATTPIHGGTISAKYAAPIGPLLTAPNPRSTRGRTFGSAHHRNAIHCAGQLPVTAPCTRLSRCLMVSSHTLALTA